MEKELSLRDTGLLQPPSVSQISQPHSVTAAREVTLSCHIAGHFPGELKVTWLQKQKIAHDPVPVQDSPKRRLIPGRAVPAGDGKSFEQEARLVLTAVDDKDLEAEFICRVEHVALQTPIERHCRALLERVPGTEQLQQAHSRFSPSPPELSRIQVLPHWDPPGEVPFAVHLQNFFPREIHRIEWSVDGKALERSETRDFRGNKDGTFTARSVSKVPSCRLTSAEQRVRVSVQHGPGDPPIEGELSLADTGLLRPPEMSEISQPQSVTAGKKVTLSCRVAGHFPGELGVTWLRKGRGEARAAPLQDSAEYQLVPGQPVPAADGKSFQQEAKLLFTPSVRRDQGAEYICRVGHAALQTPAERCSTELQVTDTG
ncbi:hypothetical protein Y1Q_0018584 [Alligator mississippiensis]|uniref:Ig-like domain-containing protein n=1 Tax=Alligator mississippiensis TaxID=8496 RepID=A0A151MW89_ALLMI|nr:hypothetical protein Y1Q_0018584 [Alligator mississippiensis]